MFARDCFQMWIKGLAGLFISQTSSDWSFKRVGHLQPDARNYDVWGDPHAFGGIGGRRQR